MYISKTLIVILLLSSIYMLATKEEKEETWQGVYYPNGCLVCEEDYIFSPLLSTQSLCLRWAEKLKANRNNVNDSFECGKNCKPFKHEHDFLVCEETVN